MKKLLIHLGIVSVAFFSQPAVTADLSLPPSLGAPHRSVVINDLRPAAPAGQLQLAVIGDSRTNRSANLRDADTPAEKPVSEGLPSTPVALASLLLILCILIGRRNGQEHV